MSAEFDRLVDGSVKMLKKLEPELRAPAEAHLRDMVERAASKEGSPDFAKGFADRVMAAIDAKMQAGSASAVVSLPRFQFRSSVN